MKVGWKESSVMPYSGGLSWEASVTCYVMNESKPIDGFFPAISKVGD